MLFYSEKLNKKFATENECLEAEAKYDAEIAEKKALMEQKKAARKEAAAKVEEAYKAKLDAEKEYREVLNEFCKEYGSYHKTITSIDEIPTFDSLFDTFFGKIF